jgi:glucokinase
MDPRRMRIHNSDRVLQIIRDGGPISRADVTRVSKLSAPTVSALINDLLAAGLAEECGEGSSSGGRKPLLVSFNARCGVVLGANIETTLVRLAVADMEGRIIDKRVVELRADTRPRNVVRQFVGAANKVLKEVASERSPLLAVAVGAPGMTDVNTGFVLEAANLEKWTDVPLRQMLQDALNVPCLVENDVNLAAMGERWRGVGTAVDNLVFVSWGTGIGAGILLGGKLHRGRSWHAGEISHLNVDFREWDNDFAAAGYLESYLGGVPETRAARAPRRAGGAVDHSAILRLGAAIANIATLLDPDAIVFGGRVALKSPDLLKRIHEVASRIAPNCPSIQLTTLGEDASLYGSLQLALEGANQRLNALIFDRPGAAA